MTIRIEKYSRKPLVGRRQYSARIVEAHNGNPIWRTTESYNNRSDRDYAIDLLGQYMAFAEIVDLDSVKGAEIEL